MKKFGYFLFSLGMIIAVFGMSMDTTVETGGQTIGNGEYAVTVPKSRVHNIGRMNDRQTIFYSAGLSLLLGAIFIGFGTLATNAAQGQSAASPQAVSSQQPSQLQKFLSGAIISPDEVEGLAALAKQYPSIASATSRINGNSLLHVAASYGLRDAAALLLEAGAEKTNRNGNGQRAYQLAKDESVADLLRVVS
jgi:F0F1-type ATP synthase membrane subunit c/vacuolar-type H+-ATPase subunit K